MTKNTFVALGHITCDTKPFAHLGGSVYYSALTAKNLGLKSQIITKAVPSHPLLKDLSKIGVNLELLPSQKNNITTFENIYDKKGNRTQFVTQIQESITSQDLTKLPSEIFTDSVILIAPVIDEVSLDTLSLLAPKGFIGIAAQGYLRETSNSGKVIFKKWQNFENYLKQVQAVIFSEEDITINGTLDVELLENIKKYSKLTVLTQGEKGAIIFEKGKQALQTKACNIQAQEIKDFTGAGDTFAAAFLIEYSKSHDIIKAASLGHLMAANRIKQE